MLDFKGSWVQYLPLIEFAYNNSYRETIGMLPYEAFMDVSVNRPCIRATSMRDRHWGHN